MAAGALPKPGTKFGPCPDNTACEHRDCMETRRLAAMPCRICGEPIGYDRGYYQSNNWQTMEHSVCAEMEIEGERNH